MFFPVCIYGESSTFVTQDTFIFCTKKDLLFWLWHWQHFSLLRRLSSYILGNQCCKMFGKFIGVLTLLDVPWPLLSLSLSCYPVKWNLSHYDSVLYNKTIKSWSCISMGCRMMHMYEYIDSYNECAVASWLLKTLNCYQLNLVVWIYKRTVL